MTKNYQPKPQNHERGNAMIYVLIALALFGYLTITLNNQNTQSDNQNLDNEKIELYANELITYAATASNSIEMMISTGSEIDDLDFTIPGDAGFDAPPIHNKVFHPAGGGLNYQPTFSEDVQNGASSIWAVNNNINVEWTDSTAKDVILTAYFINKQVCQRINKIITGSTTIPVTANPHADYFLSTGTTDLNVTECADCEGYANLCVENNTNDNYSFYNIIAAQ